MRTLIFFIPILFIGCTTLPSPPPGIGEAVDWDRVPGWLTDSHAAAWPGLLQSCRRLERNPEWRELCLDASSLEGPDDATARAFFETHFAPHGVRDGNGDPRGLITGYYEPLLEGSRVRTEVFCYPIHGRPRDLLVIGPSEGFPDIGGRSPRGRISKNGRPVPYFSRAQILGGREPIDAHVIAWADDPVALFFLHVQGSGSVRLRDGTLLGLGYAGQNGYPYVSIGRLLIRSGEIEREDMSMQAIRDWLRSNPHRMEETLNANPRYIFFAERTPPGTGPVGTFGVSLTAQRSIAVDPRFISLGFPVWLDTTLPVGDGEAPALQRLVFAQDTGSAVRGPVRADLFWGSGPAAAAYAGRMRQSGRLYVLLPGR